MATPFDLPQNRLSAGTSVTAPQLERAIQPMLADRNWQDAGQPAFVERAAVISTTLNFAQMVVDGDANAITALDFTLVDPTSLVVTFNQLMDHLRLSAINDERDATLFKPLTKQGASALIDWLGQQDWANRRKSIVEESNVAKVKAAMADDNAAEAALADAERELEDGMYLRPDNTIYKVYRTRAGQQVAKRAAVKVTAVDAKGETTYEATMVYEGKAPLRTLTPLMRMSMEEAQQFGALYNICCICGTELNNEVSVALGIGPWCGGREFGEPFKVMVKTTRKEIKAKAKDNA
jgi:hypothetical protein